MELIQFIAESPSHFFGTVIILLIIFSGIASIIRALKGTEE